MGLDIRAYKQVEHVPHAEIDEDGYPVDDDNHMKVFINDDFASRADDIKDRSIYTTGKDSFGFRAGAYSGYNRWRNELAELAGHGSAENVWSSGMTEGAFVELINFSDCEGIICPKTSAKLATDFANNEEKAKEIGGQFLERYQNWKKAFEFAAENGLVDFH